MGAPLAERTSKSTQTAPFAPKVDAVFISVTDHLFGQNFVRCSTRERNNASCGNSVAYGPTDNSCHNFYTHF